MPQQQNDALYFVAAAESKGEDTGLLLTGKSCLVAPLSKSESECLSTCICCSCLPKAVSLLKTTIWSHTVSFPLLCLLGIPQITLSGRASEKRETFL